MDICHRIACCENVAWAFYGKSCPCSSIVLSQGASSSEELHIPEPWAGRIATAQILFVSSNPAFNPEELSFPKYGENAEIVRSFCNDRFHDLSSPPRSIDGTKVWINGAYRRVNFWVGAKNRAREILDRRDVCPGEDYALTEIVHCKSANQKGVSEATDECVKKYLSPILQFAGARILVIFGKAAEQVFRRGGSTNPSDLDFPVSEPIEFEGKKRILCFLPHPNARVRRTCEYCWGFKRLCDIRRFLRQR